MKKLLLATSLMIGLASSSFANVSSWERIWKITDFSKTSIDFNDVMDGGPGKDGIPAIVDPNMLKVSDEGRLSDREPVMTVELEGQTPRAYPIRYLMWHEIVNDSVDGIPFSVTFCPLCNSGVVFDRRLNGNTHTLGVSGMLRNSDMIMYDRETETWWQQFTGEAIVGELLGKELKKLPGWMESWAEFKTRNPNGLVQDQPKSSRRYGQNPYGGYDTGRPFLYRGENPPHNINPMTRVVVIDNKAWPLTRFEGVSEIKENGVTISWNKGTASALDSSDIGEGRDVGSIRVKDGNGNDVVHDVAFAFAFHAFYPDGTWMLGK